MITFVLPGYSPHNKEWVMETAQKLDIEGEEVRPVLWEHWMDPEKIFKPEKKVQDIIDVLLGSDANIIAKSVGTLVAVLTIAKIPKKIKKVILCGIPSVSEKRLKIFKDSLRNFAPENITVIQNTQDPLASSNQVREFMKKVNPKIKVIEKEASNHDYPYFSEFQMIMTPLS